MHASIRSRALTTSALVAAALGLTAAQASAATTAQVQNGTLTVTGTIGADDIALRLQLGVPTTLEVDTNGDFIADFSFDRGTFTAIDVLARGGDDKVQNFAPLTEVTTFDGGGGADTLIGGLGMQTLVGGSGNDAATGGDGDDTARLGTGDDRFSWNPGDDDDVVDGEGGADALDFNGSNAGETIDVSANGSRVRLLRDVANVDHRSRRRRADRGRRLRRQRHAGGRRRRRHRARDVRLRPERDERVGRHRARLRHRRRHPGQRQRRGSAPTPARRSSRVSPPRCA